MTKEENLHWLNQEIQTWENECQSKHPIKEALYAARKALEQEPRWIPVTERSPEESDDYLVTNDDGDVEKAYFAHPKDYAISKGEWREIWCEDNVVAWMPLPQPYKAESEDSEE